ncbi:MAG: carboxypeptidase regulatory-like domain-containing protein, partial [Schlesneria sp.]
HPAAWWISGLIRAEREHCCDDLAVKLCNNAVTYVTALAALEELRAGPTLTVAATGGSLLSRIRRIAVGSDNVSHRSTRWGASLIALAVIASLGLTTYFALHANDDPKPTAEQTTTTLPNDETKDSKLGGIQRRSASFEPIQGEVVDAVSGKPIKGATVRFRIFEKLPFDSRGKDKPLAELVFRNVGRYTFQLPETVNVQTKLFVERFAVHPDYQSLGAIGQGFYFLPKTSSSHARDSIRQVKMVPGKVVTGLVLDLDGQPARGIAVTSGIYRDGWQNGCEHKTTTDAKGRYRMVVPENGGRGRLYVIPNHAAAVSRAITEEFGEQQVFQLRPGTRLFGRVTDADGKGVAGVALRADGSDRVPWRYAMTDADGRYSFPPIQYGTYVVDVYDEGRFRELPKNGVRLPDVFLPQVVELPKTAPTEQRLDFHPTESVRMTARFTTSDNQPLSDRVLSISGVANNVPWWGRLREVANQPGLYELRVPRGFAGRFNENADNGGFLRITREAADGKSVPEQHVTDFDKDGISFHVVRMKPSSVTLRPTFDGKPIKTNWPRNYPQFANANDAQQLGARLPSSQSRMMEEGGIWFDAHPDIDLVLKLEVDGYKLWQKSVRIPEEENQVIEVPLVPDNAGAGREIPAPALGSNARLPNSGEEANLTSKTRVAETSLPAEQPTASASLSIKYDMPGAEAETRIYVERIDTEFESKHGRREEFGNEEYAGVRFSRLKNGDSLTIEKLPAGNYLVARYRLVDIVREGTGKALKSVYLDRQWIELAEHETKSVSLLRRKGQPISGRVVVPDDLNVNTVVVYVTSENARVGSTYHNLDHRDVIHFDGVNVDSDGKFNTEPLPPGRYKVIVEGYANHNLAASGVILPSWEGAADVIVTESTAPASIEVALTREFDREAWFKGQVAAANARSNTAIPLDQSVQLADVVREFNAKNKELEQGLDQPALTEDEVVAVLKRDEWKPENTLLNEKEIAAFKADAKSQRLPKGSSLQVLTEGRTDTFSYRKLWQVKLMLPAIGHDGFVGLTIRDTEVAQETIDPKQVAWGKPDALGLSLGVYLSPKKEKYAIGERVKLRLFVRNDGNQTVNNLTFYNVSWPKPKDFNVTDQTGAVVAVGNVHDEQWGLQWVAGARAGRLAPGDAHTFNVPFELAIGGDAPSKLVGRVIDARPGQKLSLRVREHNGNDRDRKEGEPEPESGSREFSVAE